MKLRFHQLLWIWNVVILHIQLDKNTHVVNHLPNIRNVCSKVIPYIYYYYKKEFNSYNKTAYNILTKDIYLILPTFKKRKKEKRGIITTLAIGFIG